MNGPCTLLAQPHYNRYIDADGEHVIPWVGGVAVYKQPLVIAQDTYTRFGAADEPPIALSHHLGLSYPARNYIAPAMAASYGETFGSVTVANGSKGALNAGAAYVHFPAIGDAAHYVALMGAHEQMVASYRNFRYTWLLLTASGANLTATRQTLAGTPASGCLYAIVYNGASAPRTFQLIVNGSNFGTPYTVPANTFALIARTGSGFSASIPVGIKVTDSVNGEKYLLLFLGLSNYGGSAYPVPMHDASVSTEMNEWNDDYGTVTPWAGTAYASVASEGERFWRVPITRAHFPGERAGAIVGRYLPFGWPAGPNYAAFCISPMGQESYDWVVPAREYGLVGYRNVSSWGDIATEQSFVPWWTQDANRTLVASDTIDGFSPFSDHPTPDAPPSTMYTASLQWDGHDIAARDRGVDLPAATRAVWEGTDFPFGGYEPEDSQLYLYGGHPQSYWNVSVTLHRDVAVFDRTLTAAELAFLEDPDGVWGYNMFAPPASVTVSGLSGTLYTGDTATVDLTVRDADGDPIPLYGHAVWLTIKSAADTSTDDDDALAQCDAAFDPDGTISAGSGLAAVDLLAGQVRATFTVPVQSGKWDIQVRDIDGRIRTLATGTISPQAQVTMETEVA